jgi:hypothetical protein
MIVNEKIERILNKIKKGAELTKIGEKEIKFPSGNKFVIFDDDDCRMMQDYINGLNQENARLKDKIYKINEVLNKPTFEYDNIPNGIEEEIDELKNILKEN